MQLCATLCPGEAQPGKAQPDDESGTTHQLNLPPSGQEHFCWHCQNVTHLFDGSSERDQGNHISSCHSLAKPFNERGEKEASTFVTQERRPGATEA